MTVLIQKNQGSYYSTFYEWNYEDETEEDIDVMEVLSDLYFHCKGKGYNVENMRPNTCGNWRIKVGSKELYFSWDF